MAQAMVQPETRSSRFWLYTPFVLLALIAAGWSAGWFMVRNRAAAALDSWLAAEANAGRQWTCRDRTMGGYPFNIIITCSGLDLQRGSIKANLGPLRAVAQVYQPRHVIAEIDGPFQLTDGTVTVQGTWQLLEASFHGSPNGFQRISLVTDAPSFQITGGAADLNLASQHFEAHLRPSPGRAQEGAYDVAMTAQQAKLPILDDLIGGAEPTDIQVDVTATQAEGFRGRPVVDEVERWRNANGRIDILLLSLTKGARRMEAKGQLRLDELHRPAGELNVAATGLDGLIGNVLGGRAGGNVLGSLLGQARGGQARGQASAGKNGPALSPLPPLRLDNGRLLLGPFVVPSIRLPALY